MTLHDRIAPARLAAAFPTLDLALAITDIDSGESVTYRADTIVPVASAAKVLLLATVVRLARSGELSVAEAVPLQSRDRVGGTGVLRMLRTAEAWTVGDLAYLAAAVSDNCATNALLRHIGGPAAVQATADALELGDLSIHDQVRDDRGPQHPPVFATGTARDLCRLMQVAATGRLFTRDASAQLLAWMAANEDHGLVCALLRHDPYDPTAESVRVWNKTGRDAGVRADVGVVEGGQRFAYAAVATCQPGSEWDCALALRAVGVAIGDAIGDAETATGACRSPE